VIVLAMLDNLGRYSEDRSSIWSCMMNLGQHHPSLVTAMTPELLRCFARLMLTDCSNTNQVVSCLECVCPGGVMVRALDLRLDGCGFNSRLFHNLWQVVRTHVPLSPSSIIWYRSRGGDALRLGR